MNAAALLAAAAFSVAVWCFIVEPPRRGPLRQAAEVRWRGGLVTLRRIVAPQSGSHAREIAALTAALASELRSGQSPDAAWHNIQQGQQGTVGELPGIALEGADPLVVMQRWARLPGWSGLAAVAVCWQLADSTGAGLADALDRVGEAMRHEHEVSAEVHGQLAATRATAMVLVTLPIAAVAMGSVLGADPLGVLLGTAVGLACLGVGIALSALGWWWITRQIEEVRRSLKW